MKKFHNDLKKSQSRHCIVCKELWPTSENNENEEEYTCRRCEKENQTEDKFHKFGIENDMIRDLTTIPDYIQIHFANLTMLEEMLLSPVLPIMTVYRLPSGGNVSRGFVANFKQDSVSIIKEIPLQPKDIPIVVIRRQGQNNTSADFKVNRERVEAVGKFLVDHHEGFKLHTISFNQENCDNLPEDGIITGISTFDDDDNSEDVVDEGKINTFYNIEYILLINPIYCLL